ncbi:MAG: 50S ribosomal protein L22 [Actinobacteria bacterium]|nr:50S ribosomal protein L22 [Actinomycetota bacterium]
MQQSEAKNARAISRYVRISPRKARLIANEIKGKHIDEAFKILAFSNKRAARFVFKTLSSAVANAEKNHGMDRRKLYVVEARVDEGPTLKRWRPRAFGRASMIRKRTSHIMISVAERGGIA